MTSRMTISPSTEALQEGSARHTLIEEIDEAVRNRDWANVHRLSGELLVLEGSLDFSMLSLANIDNDINNSDRSSSLSSRICNSGFYDRLTVLQAAPLVYFCKKKACWQPLPPIHFRWEKEELIKALGDAHDKGTIDVDFDVAMPDRLNAFLTNDERSPILHISCHGMVGGELVFENGFGREKFMTVEALQKYHSLSSLTAVFVSACHSRSIGGAFVNAGVKHVICCTNAAKLKDSAAIEFICVFYRALAHGRTLKDAFALAKDQVMHSPSINDSHIEVDKFILLPERDDEYHNVPIFFQRPSVRPPVVATVSRRISIPSLPKVFMDRNHEAFDIINRLFEYDVVKLVGPKGIGKTSLATFVATYVSERHHFSNVVCFLKYDTVVSLEEIRQEMNELVDNGKSTLLVLDAGRYTHLGKAVFVEEIQNILNLPATVKMLIVSDQEVAVEFPANIPIKEVELKPLTYHSTVTLFATMCPHVKECADTMVHSVHDFVNLVFNRKLFLEERNVNVAMPTRAVELFEKLGAGYPKEIVRVAKTLSRGDYKAIIKIAEKYEVILKPFHSRRQLECAILGANLEILQARKDGLIHKAQTALDRLKELERQLESKPSLMKLRQEYDQVKAKLREATIACEEAYYSGRSTVTELSKRRGDLTEKLKKLADRIKLEREVDISEGASCGEYGDQSDAVPDDVGQIFVVDDRTIPPRPIPQIAGRPLLPCRIKVEHPSIMNLDSQLIENAREGNLNMVLGLLRNGADLNVMDAYGNTPLICASWNGHLEVVRVFLNEDGVDVNVKGEYGNTAVIWASLKGHVEVIRALLNHDGVDVHSENERGQTALDVARDRENNDVVSLLKEYELSDRMQLYGVDVHSENERGQTALDVARDRENDDVVSLLKEYALSDRIQLYGVDVHSENERGQTALDVARDREDNDVVSLLKEYALSDRIQLDGVDVHSENERGQTALDVARDREDNDVVSLLKEYELSDWIQLDGVDVHSENELGPTALDVARGQEDDDVVSLLMEYELSDWIQLDGVDAHSENERGQTALDVARDREDNDVVSLLKEYELSDWIQLEHEVDISETVSSAAHGDQSDAVPDDDEVEDIPVVGQIFVVDDSATPPLPIPQIAVRPLLTYRIKGKHPFVLQVNQGPAQSFSYSSSDKAAIVVASNEACTGGQGILKAVTDAGGPTLLQEVSELPVALHSEFGPIRCLAGDAKIVGPGSFGGLGVPYVMFAVGPWFTSENEDHRLLFLTGAYRSALKLAEEYKLEAVAFSLIGCSFRGGKSWKETVAIGLNTIIRFSGYPELKEIHLYGFTSDEATELRERSMEANAKFELMEQLERR